jgi:hypothetical protein
MRKCSLVYPQDPRDFGKDVRVCVCVLCVCVCVYVVWVGICMWACGLFSLSLFLAILHAPYLFVSRSLTIGGYTMILGELPEKSEKTLQREKDAKAELRCKRAVCVPTVVLLSFALVLYSCPLSLILFLVWPTVQLWPPPLQSQVLPAP